MAILVTGGAGYIGGHMVLALVDAGEQVVVLDDLSTGFAWAVPAAATLVAATLATRRNCGRLPPRIRSIRSPISRRRSSCLIQSADPLGYYLNNTVKARTLMEFATRNGIGNFIFSSTAAVYGEPTVNPIFEDSADGADQSLWTIETHGRVDAGGCRPRAWPLLCRAALLQRSRRRSQGPPWPVCF